MQQFVIPQFIDIEDKIFGPITTRQFLILLAGGALVFLGYRYGDLSLFLFMLIVIGGLSATFAFVRIKGQDFHYFILNVSQTMRRPSLRVWRKHYTKAELDYRRQSASAAAAAEPAFVKREGRRHIRDLSLVVNTGGYYRGEDQGS